MNQYSQAHIKNFTGCEGILYAYLFMCLATLIQYIEGSHIRHTFVADYIEQKTKGDTKENEAVCIKQNPGNVLKPNNPVATSASF